MFFCCCCVCVCILCVRVIINKRSFEPFCVWLLLFFAYKYFKIQTHKRFKRTLFIRTKHNVHIFGVNPLYQATKRHLNNS